MFKRFFIGVLAFGALVGFLAPSGPTPAPAPAVLSSSQLAAPAKASDNGIDTVLERHGDGHFYVDALVNDRNVHFVVDTGASVVALTKEDARAIGVPFDENQFRVIGRGASGDVRGQELTLHHIAIGQKEAWDVRAIVLADGLDVSLLGQNYLGQLGSVSIANDRMTLR